MRVMLKKWGNSASVRIPAAMMESAKLKLDMVVDVREERGQIIITPLKDVEFDLDTLLGSVTAENLHSEVSFGMPVGNESF